jgi:hypothetical protein
MHECYWGVEIAKLIFSKILVTSAKNQLPTLRAYFLTAIFLATLILPVLVKAVKVWYQRSALAT